jgi:PAS domain-containing protein
MNTQNQLQQSENRFQVTFEQAAVGIALVSRWTLAACQSAAVPHPGLPGRRAHRDDVPAVDPPGRSHLDEAHVARVLAGTIPHYTLEKRYLHKGGEIIWTTLTVALVRDAEGNPDYFISIIEDNRQNKETEEALRRNGHTARVPASRQDRELALARGR